MELLEEVGMELHVSPELLLATLGTRSDLHLLDDDAGLGLILHKVTRGRQSLRELPSSFSGEVSELGVLSEARPEEEVLQQAWPELEMRHQD